LYENTREFKRRESALKKLPKISAFAAAALVFATAVGIGAKAGNKNSPDCVYDLGMHKIVCGR
jgi:hypothetical protein